MFAPDIEAALACAAREFQLPLDLVLAVATVESGGDAFSTRFEPGYSYLWDVREKRPLRLQERTPPAAFPCLPGSKDDSGRTEWVGQKQSWGLMQVMGAVARERGFHGEFFSELCDPVVGAHYGCAHLRHLYCQHYRKHGWEGVLAAYNAGAPESRAGQAYAAKALKAKTLKARERA